MAGLIYGRAPFEGIPFPFRALILAAAAGD